MSILLINRARITTSSAASYIPPDWDELRNFEFGVDGGNAQSGTQGWEVNVGTNLISTTRSYSGTRSSEMQCVTTSNDVGGFAIAFPTNVVKGDVIWMQQAVWIAANPTFIIDVGASTSLKYMRVLTKLGNGVKTGHFDLQLFNDSVSQTNQFRMTKEGTGVWENFGAGNSLPRGEWVVHTLYMKLDNLLPSEGGQSRVCFWQNNTKVVDSSTTRTILNADDYCTNSLVCTAWNGNPPQNQSWWIDDIRAAKNGRPSWVLNLEGVP